MFILTFSVDYGHTKDGQGITLSESVKLRHTPLASENLTDNQS